MTNITPGIRLSLRGEDFLVTDVKKNIIDVEGITELVKGIKFTFDLDLEDYEVIAPENTILLADTSPEYSCPNRTVIPGHSGQWFLRKADTDSC